MTLEHEKHGVGIWIFAVIGGFVVPALCFLYTIMLSPEDQTQPESTFMSCLLWYPNGWPFYFLVLYSLSSLVAWMRSPKILETSFLIRLGLYSGVVLSWQFAVLYFGASINYFFRGHPLLEIPKIVLAFGLLSTGVLYAIASSQALRAGKDVAWVTGKVIATWGWLSAYFAAWGYTIYFASRWFNSLPKTRSKDCYVATAAAQGHRPIVRSRPVALGGGRTMAVNDQLRYLKAGELVLKAALPRFHRMLRMVYDVIGPILARCLFCAVLADIAYVTLKPAEWFCRLVLRLALREHTKKIVMSVYNIE